jgi:UDP-glucose 4-epimerase
MKQILVTAGAGLIGTGLVRLLSAEGYDVVVLDIRDLAASAYNHVRGRTSDSIALRQAFRGCDAVVHLEWSGSVREATTEPYRRHQEAVTPTVLLLEMSMNSGVPLIFSSTCPYRGTAGAALSEESALNISSTYVCQKLYIESLIKSMSQARGVPAAPLRIFNAYGLNGRPSQILPQIGRSLATGVPLRINGDGEQVRDFVHASDVADAILKMLRAETFPSDPINIGTGIGTSMNELCQLAMEISGKTFDIEYGDAKAEESRFLVADWGKAHDLLGWEPKVDLRSGITQVFRKMGL